ncbi:MAG: hypothetical protein NT061_04350 [Spirochaetes bacterium]|nr:hypothetical protein [Spirochaetota bacterium]
MAGFHDDDQHNVNDDKYYLDHGRRQQYNHDRCRYYFDYGFHDYDDGRGVYFDNRASDNHDHDHYYYYHHHHYDRYSTWLGSIYFL